MSKQKGVRAGGKFVGSHTTVIPAAATVADIAVKCDAVTKISLGYIKSGLPPAKGRKVLKITRDENGTLLLAVRDNIAHQEIRIYPNNSDVALSHIAAKGEKEGLVVKVVSSRQ